MASTNCVVFIGASFLRVWGDIRADERFRAYMPLFAPTYLETSSNISCNMSQGTSVTCTCRHNVHVLLWRIHGCWINTHTHTRTCTGPMSICSDCVPCQFQAAWFHRIKSSMYNTLTDWCSTMLHCIPLSARWYLSTDAAYMMLHCHGMGCVYTRRCSPTKAACSSFWTAPRDLPKN